MCDSTINEDTARKIAVFRTHIQLIKPSSIMSASPVHHEIETLMKHPNSYTTTCEKVLKKSYHLVRYHLFEHVIQHCHLNWYPITDPYLPTLVTLFLIKIKIHLSKPTRKKPLSIRFT